MHTLSIVFICMMISFLGCSNEKEDSVDEGQRSTVDALVADGAFQLVSEVETPRQVAVTFYTDYRIFFVKDERYTIIEDGEYAAYKVTKYYDQNTESLEISYADIIRIEGLAQFQQLKEVGFGLMSTRGSVKFRMSCEDFEAQVINPLSQSPVEELNIAAYVPCDDTQFLALFPSLKSINFNIRGDGPIVFTIPRPMPQLTRINVERGLTLRDTTFFSMTPRLEDFNFQAAASGTDEDPLLVINQDMAYLTRLKISGIAVRSMNFLSHVPHLNLLIISPEIDVFWDYELWLSPRISSFSLGDDYTESVWSYVPNLEYISLPKALRPAKGVFSRYTRAEEGDYNSLGYP